MSYYQDEVLAPDFFKTMIWYTEQDKEKADYIRNLVNAEDNIIANPTTPYIPIFSERKIIFPLSSNASDSIKFGNYMKHSGAKYLFIGKITTANPDEKAYPFFTDFDLITHQLKVYAEDLEVEKEFNDGSVLYLIERD